VNTTRVWCVVDCGVQANQDTIRVPIQSGIFFDLWAALYGEITIRDGRVEQPTSATTACCVSTGCRKSKVHLVKRLEASGGLGEPGTACVMPALTSAVYAATGNRIRKLPIADQARAVTWPRAKRNVATSESRATASNMTWPKRM